MSEWISVDDCLPLSPDYASDKYYESVIVLVTDGDRVRTDTFSCGKMKDMPDSAWAEWSMYGSIDPSLITHWQPLPSPPQEQDK